MNNHKEKFARVTLLARLAGLDVATIVVATTADIKDSSNVTVASYPFTGNLDHALSVMEADMRARLDARVDEILRGNLEAQRLEIQNLLRALVSG